MGNKNGILRSLTMSKSGKLTKDNIKEAMSLRKQGWAYQGVETEYKHYIDHYLEEKGYNWTTYSDKMGKDPKNFKRTMIQNIKKINEWLFPLNLQIQILPNGEIGEEKRKEKD